MSQRSHYRQIAIDAAHRHGIDVRLFLRQMRQEANFGDATSPAGAQGPAQIIPATARAWGVRNVHDPNEAYDAAARNMAKYLRSYGGSWRKALTAYNAGPGRVGGPLPAETQHYIGTVLGGSGGEHVQKPRLRGFVTPGKAPRLNPGGTTTDNVGAIVAALRDPHKSTSLLDRFHYQLGTGKYTTTTPSTVTPGKSPVFNEGGGTLNSGPGNSSLVAKANAIDARHLPYKRGGGHGDGSNGPLDCSGAVSKLLGINPRVAAQFKTWGKPGRGKRLTIWAANDHVLVEIGGHFWGTSRSNPGGGAGWIPRGQISAAYLSRFTARHP